MKALIFAAGVLPPHAAGTERWHRSARQRREDADAAPLPEHPAFTRVMRIAAVSAGVWTVAALVVPAARRAGEHLIFRHGARRLRRRTG